VEKFKQRHCRSSNFYGLYELIFFRFFYVLSKAEIVIESNPDDLMHKFVGLLKNQKQQSYDTKKEKLYRQKTK
jgi:hypothetical protein